MTICVQASGQAATQSLAQMPGGAGQLQHEIDRSNTLMARLGHGGKETDRERHSWHKDGAGGKQEMWAAMQSLMQSVNKIEQKQDSMAKVVRRVKKIMRYNP